MEVTVYEDPACSWCWAFQPVFTAFAFEFRDLIKVRHVMGGLRDRPAADIDFVVQQWKKAESVSGMPFDCGIWKKHPLRTTFLACRAVKAASVLSDIAAHRLLRRLREALHVEQTPLDDMETVLNLAAEIGLDTEMMKENIASGRAEALFARDRAEACQHGFGFPTMVLRNSFQDMPAVLQGAVPYTDILQALSNLGVAPKQRRRFRDSKEHWSILFKIHPRLTFAEIHAITSLDKSKLAARLAEAGVEHREPFYVLKETAKPHHVPAHAAAAPKTPSATIPSAAEDSGHAAASVFTTSPSPSPIHPSPGAKPTHG